MMISKGRQRMKKPDDDVINTKKKKIEETSSLAYVVEQWTDNPKAAGRQLFCITCLN